MLNVSRPQKNAQESFRLNSSSSIYFFCKVLFIETVSLELQKELR